MTQDSTDQPPVTPPLTPETPVIAETPAPPPGEPPAAASSGGSGLPSWLPYLGLAVIPALIVGILVYVLAGNGGGSSSDASAILEGFLRTNASDDVTTVAGSLPEDFPDDFPLYNGSEVIASYTIPSAEGTTYFIVVSTDSSLPDAYDFYLEQLDQGPWQMEVARTGEDGTDIVFSRPDNADVNGQLSLIHSDLNDQTLAYLYYQDLGLTTEPEEEPFELQPSLALPPDFPTDIPIYEGDEESVIISTLLQKAGGNNNYVVSFLTTDSNVDVVEYYRQLFQQKGWTVTDAQAEATSFSIGIEFNDGTQGQISGGVAADTFEDDSAYTRVDMFLEVSARRPRGN